MSNERITLDVMKNFASTYTNKRVCYLQILFLIALFSGFSKLNSRIRMSLNVQKLNICMLDQMLNC